MSQLPDYQVDASTHLSNRQALIALEQEDRLLSAVYYSLGSLLAAGTVFFSPSGVLTLPPMWLLLRRIHKVNQIRRSMTALLATFKDQGIDIIPRLEIPGQSSLDLFARFPSKHLFAIALRSQGKSTIFYNEADEALYIRRQCYAWLSATCPKCEGLTQRDDLYSYSSHHQKCTAASREGWVAQTYHLGYSYGLNTADECTMSEVVVVTLPLESNAWEQHLSAQILPTTRLGPCMTHVHDLHFTS